MQQLIIVAARGPVAADVESVTTVEGSRRCGAANETVNSHWSHQLQGIRGGRGKSRGCEACRLAQLGSNPWRTGRFDEQGVRCHRPAMERNAFRAG
jgi:hypothetical protein